MRENQIIDSFEFIEQYKKRGYVIMPKLKEFPPCHNYFEVHPKSFVSNFWGALHL